MKKYLIIISLITILCLTGCKEKDDYALLKDDLYKDVTSMQSNYSKSAFNPTSEPITPTPIQKTEYEANITPTEIIEDTEDDISQLTGLKVYGISYIEGKLNFIITGIDIKITEIEEKDSYTIMASYENVDKENINYYPIEIINNDNSYHISFNIDNSYSLNDIMDNMRFIILKNNVPMEIFYLDGSYHQG